MAAEKQSAAAQSYSIDAERWKAVSDRDGNADNKFFYSMKTTGVYCRPSCKARLARRENVAFHRTTADAEREGFRTCMRCKPRELSVHSEQAAIVTKACELIVNAEEPLSLNELTDSVGLSPYHFHRTFKAFTGLTPKFEVGDPVPLVELERLHIRKVLARAKLLEKAARILEMNPATFWRRRKKYGM